MINAIIVDDESNAIKNLTWEVEKFCQDVKIIDSFTDPREAVSAINYLKPDCVFLDVEMPEMNGFELLQKLHFRDFELIITSAYDQYAIKAFREHAVDYLMKPVDSDDLKDAIDRIRVKKESSGLGSVLKSMISDWKGKEEKKLALAMAGKTLYLDRNEILYCKSDGNYSEIYFNDLKKELFTVRFKDLEEQLGKGFYRVHNSYIVRLDAIKAFVNQDGPSLMLANGTQIPVSRSRKSELLHLLNH
ncbi:LytR/AlgR family response regulator transcription factor [Algoriphagus yeomjeoni]|uniref:LytTR family two component transcriptional regulator n=1 Tax=Algoriphagus yeomjeoni TaxID=291403 RepID=A0A327PKG1_9BACT|nr:LytTR family DNA-binding domain-containing protein [Algoriphagus yeomjeoni]RAI90186.1 LytTR family two component transcriptional regulator [Algoriphagus yeomjeoni]